MNASKKWGIIGLLYGSIVFVLSPGFQKIIDNPGFWNVKEQLLYLTGCIAMAYMVICMIISIRLNYVNKIMGGLDKAYIVHKWTGIYAFAFSILHWVVKEGPKVLSAFNLVPPKVKSAGGVSPYTDFEKALYGFGNDMVEIAFYVMVAVLLVSLLKKVPYHIFRLMHKAIPVLFLVIAFHGVTIQIKGQWFGSLGSALLLAMIVLGTAAAVISLFQLTGRNRKVKTSVSKVSYDKDAGIIDVTLSLSAGSFSYEAGQYVFLKFGHSGEYHPFSIASYDKGMKEVRFLIKELGDFTKKLTDSIKPGQQVIMEGAYGSFTFNDGSSRQVWLAGGIGVTPFMSRLEYLASSGGSAKPVDFFYSARGESPLKPVLEKLCGKAGVAFHYTDTSKEGRLNMDKIGEKTPGLAESSLWYCGPSSFRDYLRKALKNNKLNDVKLHYDSFDMR